MDEEKRDKIKVGSLITADMLAELRACSIEVDEFECLWPFGVALRLGNLKQAVKEGLDVWWFAAEILSWRGRWSEYYKFKKLQEELLRGGTLDPNDDKDDQYAAALALWEMIKKR